MPLIKYSTTVDAYKTIAEIEHELIKHGAKTIMKNIDDNGSITSLSFLIYTSQGPVPIKLPVQIDEALKVLIKDKKEYPKRNIKATKEQAEKVAWRILKDWIDIQMALIEFKQAEMQQIFLPYIVDSYGITLYHKLQDKNYLLESKIENQGAGS